MDGNRERRHKVVRSKVEGSKGKESKGKESKVAGFEGAPIKREGGGARPESWPAGDLRRIPTETDL
jgi:hypothetical protein